MKSTKVLHCIEQQNKQYIKQILSNMPLYMIEKKAITIEVLVLKI